MKRATYNKVTFRLISGLMVFILVGCSSPHLNANEKKPGKVSADSTALKKSSTPVKAKTRSKFGEAQDTPETTPKGMQKMNRQEQVQFAREDLAKRLDLSIEQTQVSGAIEVTWRSGALGCPKPGTSYIDALVPGVLIMVKVGNKAYRYHGSPSGEPFYCPDSLAESQYLNSSDI